MSRRFCKIRPSFWHSPKVLDMNAQERLLAIYLMTNPSFQMVGIYHIPKVLMSAHTGLNEEMIEECLTGEGALDSMELCEHITSIQQYLQELGVSGPAIDQVVETCMLQ